MNDSAIVYLRDREVLVEPPDTVGANLEVSALELLVPIDQIERDPANRRIDRTAPATLSLAESIRRDGVTTRIEVVENPPGAGKRYRLMAGERRWVASQLAGLTHIPAKVMKQADGETRAVHRIVENVQRENLNIVELGETLRDFMAQEGLSQGAAAQRLSISKGAISKAVAVLSLRGRALELARNGEISRDEAYQLARLMDRPDGERKVEAILRKAEKDGERLPGAVSLLASEALAEDAPKRGRPPKEKPRGKVITYVRMATRLRSARDTEARKVDLPVELVRRAEEKFGRYQLRAMVSLHTRAWLEEMTNS